MPKQNASYDCFSMIMLDSFIRVNEKYYPQTLLEECKYISVYINMASMFKKKTGIKSELLTDVNMLLMVEKRIWGGIYHAIHRYAKENNKYMKN